MLLKQLTYPFDNNTLPSGDTITHIGIECPYLIPFDFKKTVITIGTKEYFIGSTNNILEIDQLNLKSESFKINIQNIPKNIQKYLLIDLFYE